jgi:hypothetical protein
MTDQGFAAGLAQVRALLEAPERRERVWPSVFAALVFALCALSFAAAAILAPPVELTPIASLRGAG